MLAVQAQHLLHGCQRHSLLARTAAPPIQQPVETGALVLLATAAHMPVAHTNDLRRLPPGDLFADGS